MKRTWLGFLALFQCLFIHINVEAKCLESSKIEDLLDLVDQETLVVFDLNNVLMKTQEDFGGDIWAAYEVKKRMKESGKTKIEVLDEFIPYWHEVLFSVTPEPVETTTLSVFRQIQKRGIKVLGLTSRYIELAYLTHHQLREIYIDFKKSRIHPTDLEISGEFAAKYIDGILFSGLRNDKGDTLIRFLEEINFKPKKIIFIDDKLKNVKSVEKAVENERIEFIGVRYSKMDEEERNYDPEISTIQEKYFGEILPDEIAKTLSQQKIHKMRGSS